MPRETPLDVTLLVPVEAEPKPRPRTAVVFGRAKVYTPKKALKHEAKIAELAQAQLPPGVIAEPVRLDILFVRQRPQALMGKKHPDGLLWAPRRPDLDNLQKTVMDALKPFWRDDALVCCGLPLNCFAEKDGRPRIVVRIRSAELFDPNVVARELGLAGAA